MTNTAEDITPDVALERRLISELGFSCPDAGSRFVGELIAPGGELWAYVVGSYCPNLTLRRHGLVVVELQNLPEDAIVAAVAAILPAVGS